MPSPTGDEPDTSRTNQRAEERRKRIQTGQRVVDIRERRQLSQEQLAVRANVSRSSVQAVERGEGSRRTLQRIATALGVDIDQLTGDQPSTTATGPDLSTATTADLVAELHRRIVTAPTAGAGLRIVAEDGRAWHDRSPEDQEQIRVAIEAALRQSG
jgi:transcriptional regulator with XRE-family HTH domain